LVPNNSLALRGAGLFFFGAVALLACRKDEPPAPTAPAPSLASSEVSPTAAATTAPSPEADPDASAPAVAIPLPLEDVVKVVNPSHRGAYTGPTGIVEGRVLVQGPPPPSVAGKNFARCPEALATRGKLFREGVSAPGAAPLPEGARPLVGAIVGITGYDAFLPERNPVKRVETPSCDEAPRTISMTFGQRLELVNGTKLVFGPFLEEAPVSNVMVAQPRGGNVSLFPTRPGHFTLLDRLGANDVFRADVYVLLQPLHATTNGEGRFRIEGVPVGKVNVYGRLAAIDVEASTPLEVKKGVVHEVDVVLKWTGAVPQAIDLRPAASAKPAASQAPRIH
jgi:hypothetical protein